MTDSRAEDVIKNQAKLWADRGTFNSHCDECARVAWPERALFTATRTPGDKRSQELFDSTAQLAVSRFAAATESLVTPRTQRWHKIQSDNDDLNKIKNVQTYFDAVTDTLFRLRYSPKANFASQSNEVYMSTGVFGNGSMMAFEMPATRSIRYKSIPFNELVWCEDWSGIIDTDYRKFQLTAQQAVKQFGDAKDMLPDSIVNAAEKEPYRKFDFIHCVMPNSDIQYGHPQKGKLFVSRYISVEGRALIEEEFLNTSPYVHSRYLTTPGEVYGRGPVMMMLAEVKMLQQMRKSQVRMGQLQSEPPLLMSDDAALQAFDMRPNALNPGGLNAQGQRLVMPLEVGGNFSISKDMIEDSRKSVNDGMGITLFQVLVDSPNMTATEAMFRNQEKGQLLAPMMGRQQSEFVGPCIEREIDLAHKMNLLPPMPQELIEAGAGYRIEYVSPINRLQKADEGVAILNTIQSITPMAQADPSVIKVFNFPAIARELAEINGLPSRLTYSEDEVAAQQQQDAQQQQLAQLTQAAPLLSQSVKNLSDAQRAGLQTSPVI